MSSQFTKGQYDRAAVSPGGAGLIARWLTPLREALVGPLKPFPLAHVATGGAGLQYAGNPEPSALRDASPSLGIAGLPSATLQHAHAFMTMLPTWLPMPETRRHGHGQIVLEWHGDTSRKFSVVVGADGMLIYAARLGARGRFDGAEPIGTQLSPIVLHAINLLKD